MINVIVASQNPVKIQAVRETFVEVFPQQIFNVQGCSVPSEVSDQPMTDAETFQGAKNRTINARALFPEADFWVGLEGGVEQQYNSLASFAWMYVQGVEKEGKGRSATFFLPNRIAELIDSGLELGEADDIVFEKQNSKQKGGAVGLLTKGLHSRCRLYKEALLMALIPFMQEELY